MRAPGSAKQLLLPAVVLGIALSGFFDGILLHQVLQWHHLLSLVPGEQFRSISTQIFADGMFHALMYAVTAAGLWLLWKRRDHLRSAGASSVLAGGGLLGFGGWNIADVAVFHWAMGIHRIRVNVDNPMAYDVAWLTALGLVPLVAGVVVLRRKWPHASSGRISAGLMAVMAVASGALASLPSPGQQNTLVLTTPDQSVRVLNAALASGAGLALFDREAGLMVLVGGNDGLTGAVYGQGALLVSRSPALAGCAVAIA